MFELSTQKSQTNSKISTNMLLKNFQNVCRTCLCTNELQSIENNVAIIEMLQIITDYKNEDKLPKNICEGCVLKVTEIRSFVLQCKTSDKTLKNYLTKKNDTSTPIKNEVTPANTLHHEVILSDAEQENTCLDKETSDRGSGNSEQSFCEDKQTDPVTYKCEACSLDFTDLRKYTRHKKVHSSSLKPGKKPPKNVTNATNATIQTIEAIAKIKGLSKYEAHKCDACDMVYTSAEHLAQHKRVHHNKNAIHKCQVCAKQFVYFGSWIRHQVLHENERSFKCDVCGKTFNFMYNLKVHRRVHTGSKPYKCSECDRRFPNSTRLKRHQWLHANVKPYLCEICSKAFTEPNQLKQHKRTHSGEKPYFCQLCEKGFSFSNSLIRHNRTHTGERPYKCKICFKKFTDSSNLARHIKIHL